MLLKLLVCLQMQPDAKLNMLLKIISVTPDASLVTPDASLVTPDAS